MLLKRLLHRYVLMNEAGETGDAGGGAEPAATPAEPPAAADTGLTPPESLLNDKPDGEAKPEGDKPADKPEGEEPPAEVKPVEYTDFTLPEGVTLDAEKLGEFKKIAGEAQVPQEVAQKMVDLYSAEMKQLAEAPYRAWTELQTKWQDEIRNDPVIGGQNLDQNLAATKAGIKNLLGEDAGKFFEALNLTGAGNNPDIVRGLFKAVAPHAPATPVRGNPGSGSKTAGATLYPQMAGLGNGHES